MTETTGPSGWDAIAAAERSAPPKGAVASDWGGPDSPDTSMKPSEPYVLMSSTTSHGARPLQIREALAKLDSLTSRRWLTVIMGPETTDAAAIASQSIKVDTELEKRLAGLPSDEADEVLAFYDDLFKERGAGRSIVEVTPSEPIHGTLAQLRLTLLRVAYRATRLYVLQWASGFGQIEGWDGGRASSSPRTPAPSRRVRPVHDWESHGVTLDRGAGEKQLRDDLKEAIDLLVKFRDLDENDRIKLLLGHESISMRLAKIRAGLKADRNLQGPVVEWLTDLAWHALIFDSPCYPNPGELAFQISVAASTTDHPFHRLEPTAMADRDDADKFRKIMKHAMRRALPEGDAPAGEPGTIQRAVAAALFGQWERFDRSEGENPPFPIAISLTTDLELERALAFHGALDGGPRSFFVAFPIVMVRPNNERSGELRWIAGEFTTQTYVTGRDLWQGLARPVDGWHELGEFIPEGQPLNLVGPLLLKVNGSPLHHVDMQLEDHPHLATALELSRNWDAQLLHAPAVTELDVLQLAQVDQWALGAKGGQWERRTGLPTAVYEEFDEVRRSWLLLGHDLTDWSSRLQLFIQISRSALARGEDPPALAIGRRLDPDRARLLHAFRIKYAGGAFEECARHISHSYAPHKAGSR